MLDSTKYTPRLKAFYLNTIRAALKEEFSYKSEMMIPKLEKIVLNIGAGTEAVRDSKKAKTAAEDLTTIAGQQDVSRQLLERSKQACLIANSLRGAAELEVTIVTAAA